MSNLDLTLKDTKEKVRKIVGLQRDDFDIAIGKTSDVEILRELYLSLLMKDRTERLKVVKARAQAIGITIE